MPSPSNVFLNWSLVSIVATPNGGGSPVTTTVDGVLDVDPGIDVNQLAAYGDALMFPKLLANVAKSRSLTITAYNIAKLLAIPEESTCVITCVLNDAKNRAVSGGGGIQLVLSNACRASADLRSPNNTLGAGTVTFNAYATGDADPLAITSL